LSRHCQHCQNCPLFTSLFTLTWTGH